MNWDWLDGSGSIGTSANDADAAAGNRNHRPSEATAFTPAGIRATDESSHHAASVREGNLEQTIDDDGHVDNVGSVDASVGSSVGSNGHRAGARGADNRFQLDAADEG